MASAPTLSCKQRKISSKGYLNQVKRDGWVPGVVYGHGKDSQPILIEAKELKRIFTHTGTRGIFMLQIEGEKVPLMALIRELQKSPIGEEYFHIDFLTIKSNEKVHNTVSIHLLGEDQLIAKGIVLQVVNKEMEISCLPADIPENIVCDVSNMEMGDKFSMADITLPASVELLQDPATVVCTVGQTRADIELTQAAEEEVTE